MVCACGIIILLEVIIVIIIITIIIITMITRNSIIITDTIGYKSMKKSTYHNNAP